MAYLTRSITHVYHQYKRALKLIDCISEYNRPMRVIKHLSFKDQKTDPSSIEMGDFFLPFISQGSNRAIDV